MIIHIFTILTRMLVALLIFSFRMHNVPTKHARGLSRSTTVTRQMQKLSVICTAIEQVAIEFIFRGGLPPDKCIILYSLQAFDPESTQKPGGRRKTMDGKGEYENSAKWQEQTKIEGGGRGQFSQAPRIPLINHSSKNVKGSTGTRTHTYLDLVLASVQILVLSRTEWL